MALVTLESHKNGHTLTFSEDKETEKHFYTLDGRVVPGTTTFCKGGYPTSQALIGWMIKHSTQEAVRLTWDKLTKEAYVHECLEINWPTQTQAVIEEIAKQAKKKPKEMAETAAGIGTICHDFAYLVELGMDKEAAEKLKEAQAHPEWVKIEKTILKFGDWFSRNRDEIIASEAIVAFPCSLHRTPEDFKDPYLIAHDEMYPEFANSPLCLCYAGKFDSLRRRGGRIILSDIKTSNGLYLDHYNQLGGYTPAIEYWLGHSVGGLEILRFGKENGEFEDCLIDKPEEMKAFIEQAKRSRITYAFDRVWSTDKRFAYVAAPKKPKSVLKRKGAK